MELHLKIAMACIGALIWFQCVSGDTPLNGSGMINWTCTCSSGPLGALNYTPGSNCSTSCDCIPDESRDPVAGGWICSCTSEGSPQAPGNIHNASCFSACNCTSGSTGVPTTAKRHIYSKGVIAILILCVVITTVAFLASVACYFYRKDRFSPQGLKLSSGKDMSWNSSTTLISHHSASFPENVKSRFNPITEFLHKIHLMFRRERGTLLGTITQFSYVELEQATNRFSNDNLIGLGGSSSVYGGQLKDGRLVAIKKLNMLEGPDADSSFLTEIELISRLNHCHVVPLLGYCLENQGKQSERLLVFEYMSNGNLRDCLDATRGKEPMDWATRVSIALGVAKGLEYLHEAAAPRILHRDIKSTNILLDDMYRAKITDLGMAKRLIGDDLASCSSSPARMLGTFGYFAPEYAIVGKASLKSDVFSFGVVILELITGRQPIHKSSNKGDESLVIWAMARLHDSKLVVSELPDPLLKGNFPDEEMQIMAHLARECLQWDPDGRPSMSEVVQIISVISSEKSKRKAFPVNLFMSFSSRSTKSSIETERSQGSVDKREHNQTVTERRQARCSLPLSVDRKLCQDQQQTGETILSTEYMDKLILLTSNGRSWRSSDDETVDLTEPRFESFMQANIRSL